ncbi:MAG: MFS transporter [Dehalococcoidia bacterium]|nr:MFS transporter [Dehalococcoidia bacterium]
MTTEPHAADGIDGVPYWRRNLWVVTIVIFVTISSANLVFPFMPLFLKEDIGLKGGAVAFWSGMLNAVLSGAMFLFSPIWGTLSDRWGRKKMLVRAYIAATLVIFLHAVAQNVWQLVIVRLMQGAFSGTTTAALALAAAGAPRDKIGYSMGLVQSAMFSSQLIGPLAGGLLAAAVGYRMSFVVTGVVYAICGILLWALIQEVPANMSEEARRRSPLSAIVHDLRGLTGQRSLLTILIVLLMFNMGNTLSRPLLALIVESVSDARVAVHTGYVFAALALTGTIASLTAGRATQLFGYRRWLLFSLLGAALLYIPVVLANSIFTLALAMAAVGLFSGATLPTTNALIGATTEPGKEGASYGLAASMQALAGAVGPFIGGAVAAGFGIQAGFIGSAIALGLAAALTFVAVRDPETGPAPAPAPAS